MLFQSYRETAHWDRYKNNVVETIVAPHRKENGRFSKISKAQILIKRESERRKVLLLSTLERCSEMSKVVNKRQKIDGQFDSSDEDDGTCDDYSSRSLYVLAHQTLQKPFKPIQKDFSVGRRASLMHGITTLKDPYNLEDDSARPAREPRRHFSKTCIRGCGENKHNK